ncbi:MAG: glycosyltransferase [Candidatus Omnitrophota bacterium]
MSLVSVVIPTYNSSQFIAEAIDSVLCQTYPEIEVVVVDDGSSDDTISVLDAYAKNNQNKIRYFSQKNSGPAAARNKGIGEAKGEFIAFLDSDDMWFPEKIAKQMKKFTEDPELGLVHTSRVKLNPDGSVEPSKTQKNHEGWVFENLLMRNFICTSSVLVKKESLLSAGLFDESSNISEDYDLWLRLSQKYRCGYVGEALVEYRLIPKSHSRLDLNISRDRELAAFFKSLKNYTGDRDALTKKKLQDLAFRMTDTFFYNKNYKQAALSMFEALKASFL